MSPGPIALVGSGEYLPIMQEIEANLIAGRNPKYVDSYCGGAGRRIFIASLDHIR